MRDPRVYLYLHEKNVDVVVLLRCRVFSFLKYDITFQIDFRFSTMYSHYWRIVVCDPLILE